MSIYSLGRMVGKGIGNYMEENAKKQHENFHEWLWFHSKTAEERQDILANRAHQREFDEMIWKWGELQETIPKIVNLDLRSMK